MTMPSLAARILLAVISAAPVSTPAPIPTPEVQRAFEINPRYITPSGGPARAAVAGAFEIIVPAGRHIVAAYSPGYLPMKVRLDAGACLLVTADDIGGEIPNADLTPSPCGHIPPPEGQPQAPPAPRLRVVDTTWGYGFWADDRRREAVVTSSRANHLIVLRLKMSVVAIRGITSPDAPLSTLSVVGTLDNRSVMVVFDPVFRVSSASGARHQASAVGGG